MDDLEYSNDALEILADFYNADFTIYVEGEDDIIFWEKIFNMSQKKVHIQEVGGIEELKKYINKIIENDINIYVAKDNDYNDFTDSNITHERIFTTYGHSIENTLYSKFCIKNIIKNFSRISGSTLPDDINTLIDNIILNFENVITSLLIYEIANDIYNKGISILGKNSSKFLKTSSSIELCEMKINSFLATIANKFEIEEIITVTEKLESIDKPIWCLIRGHFLTNFVINLIKKIIKMLSNKNITFPVETLFPLCLDENIISNSEDYFHYQMT